MDRISLKTILYLSLALAFFHGLATYYNLYFFIWWFDIPMHLLGGVLVGTVALFFYRFFCLKGMIKEDEHTAWTLLIASILFVGGAWELFEYAKGITFNTIGSYRLDVLKDLAVDILGVVFSGVYYLSNKK